MKIEDTSADMEMQISMTTGSDPGHSTTIRTTVTMAGDGATHMGVTMMEVSGVVNTTPTQRGEPGMGVGIQQTRGGDGTMKEGEGDLGNPTGTDRLLHAHLQGTNGHNALY